jgi:hypothetical protein
MTGIQNKTRDEDIHVEKKKNQFIKREKPTDWLQSMGQCRSVYCGAPYIGNYGGVKKSQVTVAKSSNKTRKNKIRKEIR